MLLPVMVIHEAFYVSHALEPVIVPAAGSGGRVPAAVQPRFTAGHRAGHQSWGNAVNQDMFYRHRKALTEAMALVPELSIAADADYEAGFGRGYGILERYRMDDADLLIVGLRQPCAAPPGWPSTRCARRGTKVGLLKIKLFNPFPIEHVREAVAGVPKLVVIERNFSPGIGGVLAQTLKCGALRHGRTRPRCTATWRAWAA